MRFGRWKAEYRPHGWVRLQEDGAGPRVYLQYRQAEHAADQRFELKTVVVRAGEDDALTARTLRRIPFSELEDDMRQEVVQFALQPQPWAHAPSLDSLDEYIDTVPEGDWEGAWGVSTLSRPTKMVSDATEDAPAEEAPVVRKPPEGRLTDEFLSDVAEAYRWLTNAKLNPAPSIANTSGAPVATVRRWIYEARKRGILAPGRPGRAG